MSFSSRSRTRSASSTCSATSPSHRGRAAATAIILSLGLGPLVISRLSRLRVGERIRADGRGAPPHEGRTPTMGGVLIVGFGDPVHPALGRSGQRARVGGDRDHGRLRGPRLPRRLEEAAPRGWDRLSVRSKFGIQLLLGLAAGVFLLWYSDTGRVYPLASSFPSGRSSSPSSRCCSCPRSCWCSSPPRTR